MKIATVLAVLTGVVSAFGQSYDPSTEITFDGKVTGVLTAADQQMNLLVKSDNGGSSLVVLGPQSWVARQRVKIAMKDEVRVTGSKVTLSNKRTAILAATVTVKGQTLTLRDADGAPLFPATVNTPSSDVQPSDVGNSLILNGETIDLAGTTNPRLVVSTPEGDVQVQLGQDWYMSNQRSTYTMNELAAINGVFNNVGMPGRIIILPSQNRSGVMYWTPYWNR